MINTSLFSAENENYVSTSVVNSAKSRLLYSSSFSEKQIDRGVKQLAKLWKAEDGNTDVFLNFCDTYFCKNNEEKEKLFYRICDNFEVILGHNNRVSIELIRPLHVEGYETLNIDDIFASYDALSHFNEDMFKNKLAFVIVLNFPYYTLSEKQLNGHNWTPLEWGYVRLGDVFTARIDAEQQNNLNNATAAADKYISNYNIPMGMILGDGYMRHWSRGTQLISHWGLRDELKACYADNIYGFQKQNLIYHIMRQIINQEIPKEVLNHDFNYGWYPPSNGIYLEKIQINSHREEDERYAHLLNIFKATQKNDIYYPSYDNFITRKFESDYEMSVAETEALFEELLASEQVKEVAKLISKRLNRKLEPFDIWYDGFKARSNINPAQLDSLTLAKYPTKEAFTNDLPNILRKLGFDKETIDLVCSHVTVDASVGAGHAWESMMKEDNAMLRTRIGKNGMDYKGYNIGIHEFGHNVEQTISLHKVPNYFLRGVPNTACTEAIAFLFQNKDLELLGVTQQDDISDALNTLDLFWSCYEIMGVALVDIKVWQWMYAHPEATPAELKVAVIAIAKDIWNQYYEPVLGKKDQSVLAIYSHMIDSPLYLSAYPIGHIISFQLNDYMKDKKIGPELDRICAIGHLTPNLWMNKAVGSNISVTPLLSATTQSIQELQQYEKKNKKR